MSNQLNAHTVKIKCANTFERSVAMHFLAGLTKCPIHPNCLRDEWKEENFRKYPHVGVYKDTNFVHFWTEGNSRSYTPTTHISFGELYKLKPIQKKPVTVKLNDEYEAEIEQDTIKVGCQVFSWDVVQKLTKGIQKYKDQA